MLYCSYHLIITERIKPYKTSAFAHFGSADDRSAVGLRQYARHHHYRTTSSITMEIPSGAKKFLAVAGCDLEKSGGQTMMFFVYIDGELADHSSLIKIGQHYVFDVDIPAGAKEIRLYADESRTDGNANDHADWTVAGFINNPTEG